jgi:hypothetical protein
MFMMIGASPIYLSALQLNILTNIAGYGLYLCGQEFYHHQHRPIERSTACWQMLSSQLLKKNLVITRGGLDQKNSFDGMSSITQWR